MPAARVRTNTLIRWGVVVAGQPGRSALYLSRGFTMTDKSSGKMYEAVAVGGEAEKTGRVWDKILARCPARNRKEAARMLGRHCNAPFRVRVVAG